MYFLSLIKSKAGSDKMSRRGYLERIVSHMNQMADNKWVTARVVTNTSEPVSGIDTYVAIFVSSRSQNPELRAMKPARVGIDLGSWEGFNNSLCDLAQEFSQKAVVSSPPPSAMFRFNELAILSIARETKRLQQQKEVTEAHP